MKESIHWMRKIEHLAGETYREASSKLSHIERFSSFLSQLAEDESSHYHIMGSAAFHLLEKTQSPMSEIVFDEATAKLLETPLLSLTDYIEKNIVSEQNVVDCIISAEFSEWNKIFVYIVNKLKSEHKEFQYVAAEIQAHMERIKQFLKALPPEFESSKKLFDLPVIWENNILIVDDEESMRELMKELLSGMGLFEAVENGREALEKVTRKFYNLIISDLYMPIMDGIEFFERAIEYDTKLAQRFIVCSGNITDEHQRYFSKRGITHIRKPFNIFDFKAVIRKKLSMAL